MLIPDGNRALKTVKKFDDNDWGHWWDQVLATPQVSKRSFHRGD